MLERKGVLWIGRAKCFLGRQTINGKWMSPSIVMEMVVLCVWIDVTNLSCLPTCGLRNDNNPAHLCSTESQYISFFNARLWPTPWQTLHLLEVPFYNCTHIFIQCTAMWTLGLIMTTKVVQWITQTAQVFKLSTVRMERFKKELRSTKELRKN